MAFFSKKRMDIKDVGKLLANSNKWQEVRVGFGMTKKDMLKLVGKDNLDLVEQFCTPILKSGSLGGKSAFYPMTRLDLEKTPHGKAKEFILLPTELTEAIAQNKLGDEKGDEYIRNMREQNKQEVQKIMKSMYLPSLADGGTYSDNKFLLRFIHKAGLHSWSIDTEADPPTAEIPLKKFQAALLNIDRDLVYKRAPYAQDANAPLCRAAILTDHLLHNTPHLVKLQAEHGSLIKETLQITGEAALDINDQILQEERGFPQSKTVTTSSTIAPEHSVVDATIKPRDEPMLLPERALATVKDAVFLEDEPAIEEQTLEKSKKPVRYDEEIPLKNGPTSKVSNEEGKIPGRLVSQPHVQENRIQSDKGTPG